jgi:hypothetical protein
MYGRSGSLSLLRARVEGRKGGADCQTVTERSAAAWQLTTPRNSLTESRQGCAAQQRRPQVENTQSRGLCAALDDAVQSTEAKKHTILRVQLKKGVLLHSLGVLD